MANKYLILLVEDESNIASFITTVLRANQYEVKRAATGEEALMMASSYCPDLIILDLGLPDIDGQKVLSTVRSWTQTPVIVVSARSMSGIRWNLWIWARMIISQSLLGPASCWPVCAQRCATARTERI